jgi:hypothetical protein
VYICEKIFCSWDAQKNIGRVLTGIGSDHLAVLPFQSGDIFFFFLKFFPSYFFSFPPFFSYFFNLNFFSFGSAVDQALDVTLDRSSAAEPHTPSPAERNLTQL